MDYSFTRYPVSQCAVSETPQPELSTGQTGKSLTVKEMHPDLQPREKALRYGIESLNASELLAIILRTGIPGMPITEMMRELMYNHNNRLHEVERVSPSELKKIRGIGDTKLLQLKAIFQLIKCYNTEEQPKQPHIGRSNDIYDLMRDRIGNLSHEEVWVLLLNRRHNVTAYYKITSGGQTASVFDVRMILKRAILDEADGLILCHNHPSGTLVPSPQDNNITRQCKDGCTAVGIRFLDHLIVTAHGYYSYADEGRL